MTNVQAINSIGDALQQGILHTISQDGLGKDNSYITKLEKLEIFEDGVSSFEVLDIVKRCWIPKISKLNGDVTYTITYKNVKDTHYTVI